MQNRYVMQKESMIKYNIAGLKISSACEFGPDYQNFLTDEHISLPGADGFEFDLHEEGCISVPGEAEFSVSQEQFVISKYSGGCLYEAVIPDTVTDKARCTPATMYTDSSYHTALFTPGYGLTQLTRLALESRFISDGKVILHSSCINTPLGAVCLTAPSGTGKSTRAAALCRAMTPHKFPMISGDRPLLDSSFAYGVPWDGKEQLHLNTSAPLHSILKIKRLDECGPEAKESIRRIEKREAFKMIVSQVFIPMWDTDLAAKSMSNLKMLLENVPVFEAIAGPDENSMMKLWDLITSENYVRGNGF